MKKMCYNIIINFKGEKRWEEDKNLIYLSIGYFWLNTSRIKQVFSVLR